MARVDLHRSVLHPNCLTLYRALSYTWNTPHFTISWGVCKPNRICWLRWGKGEGMIYLVLEDWSTCFDAWHMKSTYIFPGSFSSFNKSLVQTSDVWPVGRWVSGCRFMAVSWLSKLSSRYHRLTVIFPRPNWEYRYQIICGDRVENVNVNYFLQLAQSFQ